MAVKDTLTLIDLTDKLNSLIVSLDYDKDTIIYDQTQGTYDTNSITIIQQVFRDGSDVTNNPEITFKWYKDGILDAQVTTKNYTIQPSDFSGNSLKIKVEATDSVTPVQQQIQTFNLIEVIIDPDIIVDFENIVFEETDPSTKTINQKLVYKGVELTGYTYKWDVDGVETASKSLNVTEQDQEKIIKFIATYNGIDYEKYINVIKVPQAHQFYITLSQSVVAYDPNNNTFDGNTNTVVTASAFEKIGNNQANAKQAYWQIDDGQKTSTQTTTHDVAIDANKKYVVKAYLNASDTDPFDIQTITVLNSQENGFAIIVDNDTVQFQQNSNGDILDYTIGNGAVYLYQGQNPINGKTLTASQTNITCSLDQPFATEINGKSYTVSNMTQDNAQVTFEYNDDGLKQKKIVNFTRVKRGQTLFIVYHTNDVLNTPPQPTGDGTNDGWTSVQTSNQNWMSTKVQDTIADGSWGQPIRIKPIEYSQEKTVEQPTIINLVQLNGSTLTLNNIQTVVRAVMWKDNKEININDANEGLNNIGNYKWYFDGVEQPVLEDKPEITITKDDVTKQIKIECDQKEKTKIYYSKGKFVYQDKTTDYGLATRNDGTLVATIRIDDVPQPNFEESIQIEEETTNLIVGYDNYTATNTISKPTGWENSNQEIYEYSGNVSWAKIFNADITDTVISNGESITVSGWIKYVKGNYTYPKIYLKKSDANNIIIGDIIEATTDNQWHYFSKTWTNNTGQDVTITRIWCDITDSTAADYEGYQFQIQIEKKIFSTQFVNGTRNYGILYLDNILQKYQNTGVVIIGYVKPHIINNYAPRILDIRNSDASHFSSFLIHNENSNFQVNDLDITEANFDEWQMFVYIVNTNETTGYILNSVGVFKNTATNFNASMLNDVVLRVGNHSSDGRELNGLISNFNIDTYDSNKWTDDYIKYLYENKIKLEY